MGYKLKIRVLRFVGDQNTLQQARKIAIVTHSIVHDGAIVPESDGSQTPREPHLILGLLVVVLTAIRSPGWLRALRPLP
jgi:hypothetical protein